MNELVKIVGNEVFTDSMVIAQGTDNAHRSIVKMINKYSDKFKKMGELSCHYKWSDNLMKKEIEVYQLNEPQAFFLMTLLGNSDIVVDFKFRLVEQFYKMRNFILEHGSVIWQDTRTLVKEIRKKETAAIALLVEYAFSNGSKNAKHYYESISNLADKAAGIKPKQRDNAETTELIRLYIIENMIENCIKECVEEKLYYKDIYYICKDRIEQFKKITYLDEKKNALN